MTTADWRAYETEVAEFFRRASFQVDMNPGVARPRQTDLQAKDGDQLILIEAKSRTRKVDIADIDNLRARLNRTTTDVIGAIFTTSNLSRTAIEEIEANRTRSILVFVGSEIKLLRSGRKNVRALIEQKLEALRTRGKVWISSGSNSAYLKVDLPITNIRFKFDGAASNCFESKSRFGGASLAMRIPDSGWGAAGGEGARLSIDLGLNNADDLRDIVGYLHKHFGLSEDGAFFIHQSESCWHGIGIRNFIATVTSWRDRYSVSPMKQFHHSEEFSYFDRFQGGWLQLSAQQQVNRADKSSILHHSELVIQLPGVPVNSSRFLKLCQHIGDDWACFNYVHERWTHSRRLRKPIRLKVVGTVVSREIYTAEPSQIVIGFIAKNPFYKKKVIPPELIGAELPSLSQITENELLLCDLKDHHDEKFSVDYYELTGVEVTEGGTGPIVRPFGTWNEILRE